jgi:hypothetical protein
MFVVNEREQSSLFDLLKGRRPAGPSVSSRLAVGLATMSYAPTLGAAREKVDPST